MQADNDGLNNDGLGNDGQRFGFLVNPDLTSRRLVFDLADASKFLGRVVHDSVRVAFVQPEDEYEAVFSPDARDHRAQPNPVASLAKNQASTGNPSFLQDPTSAISGPVIFTGRNGESIDDDIVEQIKQTIRAVRNYREDNPQEFELWENAVLNMGKPQD